MMEAPLVCVTSAELGKARRIDDAAGRYIEFCKSTFPSELDLRGMRIVVDCAHGAGYHVAPPVFHELGAEVIAIGAEPDGVNINAGFGATHPARLQEAVLEHGADIGVALDGDGDRLVMVDREGCCYDGDQLLYIVAMDYRRRGMLGKGVVGTLMSNLGLEQALGREAVALERAAVGDRYVIEQMQKGGFNVGGEQSGHIVLSDFSPTGDGLVAALQVLAVLAADGKPASRAAHLFEPMPQVLESVRYQKTSPLNNARVTESIKEGEARLYGSGRLLVRKSGTEPVIRVMAEGDDEALVRAVVNDIVNAIQEVVA